MAAAEAQEIDFQERLADIYKNNYEIVGPIEEYLSQIETRKHRRKEKLHQDWDDTVFSPLQTAITEIVDATSADDIQKRRRHHLSNYLQECNSKLGVFRDIIIESEYDPLHCRDQNNKRVPPEIMKQINQNSTSPRGRSTVGREVLNVTLWDKIASTPHGRYSDEKPQARRPVRPDNVKFDHYSNPMSAKEHKTVMTREFRSKGKAIIKPVIHPEKPTTRITR